MGHGFTQRNMQKVADEKRRHQEDRDVIAKATGKPPRGWLGPGLTETWETPDLLAEEGYDYVADWVLDDQPVWLKTRGRPILNLPYTQEINDVAMIAVQQHAASEYCERALDQFEQIYADAADGARHGAGGASLSHGRAAPGEVPAPCVRDHPPEARRAVLDRRADRRLVSRRRTGGAVTVQENRGPAGAAVGAGDVQARLMLVGVCLIWGVTWPVMRIALNEIPPLSMRASTAGIGTLTMLRDLPRHPPQFAPSLRLRHGCTRSPPRCSTSSPSACSAPSRRSRPRPRGWRS